MFKAYYLRYDVGLPETAEGRSSPFDVRLLTRAVACFPPTINGPLTGGGDGGVAFDWLPMM